MSWDVSGLTALALVLEERKYHAERSAESATQAATEADRLAALGRKAIDPSSSDWAPLR